MITTCKTKLSVVSTLYQSAAHISDFHRRATTVAKRVAGEDYEIIFVNDGSPDESLDLSISLVKDDPHVIVVDLSRNFGHHKAMMTGLMYSKGEIVFLIDSDLEEQPEWLIDFNREITKRECDVVYGVQTRRKGGVFERWSGRLYYFLFNILSGIEVPQNLVTARLMTRRYVDALIMHQEREVTIAGLWYITGYAQYPQPVTKDSRSKTTYSYQKKIEHLATSVTAFSNVPLVAIFYAGIVISMIAMAYIIFLIFYWVFLATPLSGWTSVMASIWLLGGMIISFVGLVGIYVAKIFTETKQRPYTIVRQIYGR